MKRLRWIAVIETYLKKSEIFTLYVPKDTDIDYRLTVSIAMDKYIYITERFKWIDAEYLLFYPREYRLPSNPMYKKLQKFRHDFCEKHKRRKPF
jgi:hypothetical protein